VGDAEATAAGPGAAAAYQTGLVRWRGAGGGFRDWDLDGVGLTADGSLALAPERARQATDPYPPGAYRGADFYNGGSFLAGAATGPVTPAGFPFHQAIASWNATTPPGTWLECLLRVRRPPGGTAPEGPSEGGAGEADATWTAWYSLGVWASGAVAGPAAAGAAGPAVRHSVAGQRDADGAVAVDTLKLDEARSGGEAFQVRLRLCRDSAAAPGVDGPAVAGAAVALSSPPPVAPVAPGAGAPGADAAGERALWGRPLRLPACSQMAYPDGGEVWCSPTSLAMVLGYWEGARAGGEAACAERVRDAVAGVYDRVYRGHGNWPFNTAYAATGGLEAFVARLDGFAAAAPLLAAGVPLVISYGWRTGELPGAPLPASNGHLAVLAGFDAAGDPVVYDPAAPEDGAVRRRYPRAELERLWLTHSGGTAYVIAPPERVPPWPWR
jgi:hypothetical protein